MTLPESIYLAEQKWKITQDADCCDSSPEPQKLVITSQNGALEWEDSFIVIKTKRWAIDPDDIDAFADMLKEFYKVFKRKKDLT